MRIISDDSHKKEERVLFPGMSQIITYPNTKRIEIIQKGVWIQYPLAEDFFNFLIDLDNQPRRPRMMGRTIIGKTGNGKTSLISNFIDFQIQQKNLPKIQHQYLYVTTPPNPSLKTLYLRTLYACGVDRCKGSTEELWHILLTTLNKLQVRMIFYDDIEHLANTQNDRILNLCRDVLKDISNSLMIPIILSGTEKAEQLLLSDLQIKSRYPIIRLDEWKNDKNFRILLHSFEMGLPLREPSYLENKELADLIYSLSEGTIGSISEVVMGSAVEALKRGEEKITSNLINSLHFARFSRF